MKRVKQFAFLLLLVHEVNLCELCPLHCQCSIQDEAVDAQCGERGLQEVPPPNGEGISFFRLNMSFNDLGELNNTTFRGYETMRILLLAYCKIEVIDISTFVRLIDLTYLDLSHNYLYWIKADIFSENPLLKSVSFSHNPLTRLTSQTPLLSGPPSISSLDLSHCMISEISPSSFSQIPNLKSLNLSNNRLKVLGLEILASLPHLEELNIRSNQWKCGRQFEDLLCWIHFWDKSHYRPIKCRNKDFSWREWREEDKIKLCNKHTESSTTISDTLSHRRESIAVKTISPDSEPKPTSPPEPGENISYLLWIILTAVFSVPTFIFCYFIVNKMFPNVTIQKRHTSSEISSNSSVRLLSN
ncbi:phospholipase A2 inhibitor beta-like [Periplaneta americana]|uniref:phospholipase A2 inhibitor beta-like n=1 Tax=Periplaneta americana TaxID=6978 RepID=UPI0037E7F49D